MAAKLKPVRKTKSPKLKKSRPLPRFEIPPGGPDAFQSREVIPPAESYLDTPSNASHHRHNDLAEDSESAFVGTWEEAGRRVYLAVLGIADGNDQTKRFKKAFGDAWKKVIPFLLSYGGVDAFIAAEGWLDSLRTNKGDEIATPYMVQFKTLSKKYDLKQEKERRRLQHKFESASSLRLVSPRIYSDKLKKHTAERRALASGIADPGEYLRNVLSPSLGDAAVEKSL